MPTLRHNFLVILFGLALTAPMAYAQQPSQDQTVEKPAQPIPAIRSPLASLADNGDATDQDASRTLDPDTRPLTGAQDLSLGIPSMSHSFWQPQASVNASFGSNPLVANKQAGWTDWTTFLGGVNVQRNSENNNLALYYLGGGSVSNNNGIGNTVFQTGELSEQMMWGRSTISFFDEMAFLPQAGFGFAGATGIPLPPGGIVGLQPGFLPDQSILTAQTQRIANSFITQVHTQLTRRTSLTFMGGYNVLHYFGTNLLDSNGFNFQAGYNYQLTREDTLSLFYRFNAFRYSNFNQSINNNSFGVSYGRRVTGRLAFHAGVGPSFSSFQTPINVTPGSGGNGGMVTGPTNQVFLSLNAGLTYEWGRTTVGLIYNHGINGGSGVLAGAVSNFLTGTATRQLTRTLNGSFIFGYSRNTGRDIATPTSSTFNYTFAGVNLSRQLGRSTTASLSYQFQYQNSSSPPCVGPACGTTCANTLTCSRSFTRNQISLGLTWLKQPIAF